MHEQRSGPLVAHQLTDQWQPYHSVHHRPQHACTLLHDKFNRVQLLANSSDGRPRLPAAVRMPGVERAEAPPTSPPIRHHLDRASIPLPTPAPRRHSNRGSLAGASVVTLAATKQAAGPPPLLDGAAAPPPLMVPPPAAPGTQVPQSHHRQYSLQSAQTRCQSAAALLSHSCSECSARTCELAEQQQEASTVGTCMVQIDVAGLGIQAAVPAGPHTSYLVLSAVNSTGGQLTVVGSKNTTEGPAGNENAPASSQAARVSTDSSQLRQHHQQPNPNRRLVTSWMQVVRVYVKH